MLPKVLWVWQENRGCTRNRVETIFKRIHFSQEMDTLKTIIKYYNYFSLISCSFSLYFFSFSFKISLLALWLSSPFDPCPLLHRRLTRAPVPVQHRLPFQRWCRGARCPPDANRWNLGTKLDRMTTGRRTIPGHWTATYH